jgi:tRNA 2-selenouridine synthase
MPIPQHTISPVFLIAGLTGSGKTALIQYLIQNNAQVLDLECLCRHDGSVFATLQYPSQPSSYQFHKQLLKQWNSFDHAKPVYIESELKKLGRITLPDWLYQKMNEAPVIWLNSSKALRMERIVSFIKHANPVLFCQCLSKLDKKLGEENFRMAMKYFENGAIEQLVEILLDYYDQVPGYRFPAERILLNLPVINTSLQPLAETIIAATHLTAIQNV